MLKFSSGFDTEFNFSPLGKRAFSDVVNMVTTFVSGVGGLLMKGTLSGDW